MPKMIFRLILCILFSLELYGSVTIVAPRFIYEGEALEFMLIAKGFDIQVPKIPEIDAYLVDIVKTSQEATLIDYKQATKLSITYRLSPKNNLILPPFIFHIDKKLEKTEPKTVIIKKITKTISKDFDLQMYLNKTELLLGDTALLRVVFSYGELEDYELIEPSFRGITLTELRSKEYENAAGKDVEEVFYELKPRVAGRHKLNACKAKLELYKNRHMKRVTIYSNSLHLTVNALPKGVSAIGSYKLFAKIDKRVQHAAKPIKLTLYLQGHGNIDNLNALHLAIKGTTIYEQESKKVSNDTYTKCFTIVSDKKYTIPSFSLTYYDKRTKKLQTTATQAFHIDIIEDKHLTKEITMTQKLLFYFLGLVTAGIIFLLYSLYRKKKEAKKEISLLQKVRKVTNDNVLFKIMVPYLGRDRAVDRIIYSLEAKENYDFKELKKRLELRLNERDDLFFTA
jgi:hypothetical protein